MNNQLEELLGAYWDIAYQEGRSGRPNGTQAQEVLSAIWAVVEQARREEREACAIAAWSAGMEYHNRVRGMPTDAREVGSAGAAAIRARNKKGGS